jgi:ABC-type branched-subunit amino acid transport system ATPase component
MAPLLEVTAVSKKFGEVQSLANVTFSLQHGGIVGLIGPNGAGKSTLINVLTGVYAPTAGVVRFAGRDIGALSTAQRARLGLVRTFQRPAPIFDLTCAQGVMVGGLVRGLGIAQAREEAQMKLALLGLAGVADQSPRKLPTGHLKLLDLARVLLLRPKLVLLDELMSGLSIGELETVLGAIEVLASEGVSFLVIEHLMEVINRLSRHLIVMDAGRIITEGMPTEIIRDPDVVAAYLGEEALEHGAA